MPRAARALVGILAAIILVAAACGGDGADVPEAGEDSDPSEPPEGAVAVVDGNEISEEAFEERYEQVLAIPAVAQQLEGEQGEAAKPMLRAQVLSQMLVSDILSRAAEDDFDIEVTDGDVRERLQELEDEAGGPDELAGQLEQAGITEDVLVEQELPFTIMIEQVQEEVAGDDVEEPPPPQPGQQQPPSEAELAFQEWALAKFADAEVSVRSEIGTWDPQSGQVQPPGGAGGFPPGQQPPPG